VLRLCNSKPPRQTSRMRVLPWMWGDAYTHKTTVGWMTGECNGGKDQTDCSLDVTCHVSYVALYSRFLDIRPPKLPETRPICRFTVAVPRCSKGDPRAVTNNTAASHRQHQFSLAVTCPRSAHLNICWNWTDWPKVELEPMLCICVTWYPPWKPEWRQSVTRSNEMLPPTLAATCICSGVVAGEGRGWNDRRQVSSTFASSEQTDHVHFSRWPWLQSSANTTKKFD